MYKHNPGRGINQEHPKNLRNVIGGCDNPISQRGWLVSRFRSKGCQVRCVYAVEHIRHGGVEFLIAGGLLRHASIWVGLSHGEARVTTAPMAKADASVIETLVHLNRNDRSKRNTRSLEPKRSVQENEQVQRILALVSFSSLSDIF
jgi:hypothetical protein